ncbi:MAG: response regulator [Mediterranea sp.]|jgi:ligand-binding sensor domain-containing protein/signal transduction histidine kinase/DNA-binding response OmpR family regulator|nr:response regulator [Mediterranea sp.]
MKRLILPLLLLILLFGISSRAAERQYAFRTLDSNSGLSQNSVNAILQDRQGFMWFGTKDGLDRYDGLRFHHFLKENGTLGNNYITALHEDRQGVIWIGTDDGLYLYSPLTETARRFDLLSDRGTQIENTINTLTGDRDGGVWIGVQGQGIFYYNPKSKQLVHRATGRGGELKYNGLERLCFDADNVCWIDPHDGQLYSSRDNLATLTPFFTDKEHPAWNGAYSNELLAGPYNCLYQATIDGLQEINLTHHTVRTLLSTDEQGDAIYIRELTLCGNELWAGTEQGIYIYHLGTGQVTHLRSIGGDPYSLSDNAIYTIYKDREEGVWIGSYFGGVNYCPAEYTYFNKIYPRTDDAEMGKRVREFCPAPDGTLWIGTEDKGLVHYNPTDGQLQAFRSPDIFHNVHGLCMDGRYLWVGNFSRGIHRVDLTTRQVKNYGGTNIFSFCRTNAGELWAGTTNGLLHYDRKADTFRSVPEMGGTFIYHIKEDHQGNLWLATYVSGLYRLNVRSGQWDHFTYAATDSTSLSSNKVLSTFEDSHGHLWFTTQGGGFCRFNPTTRTFTRYDSQTVGLPTNVIYRIEEDKQGRFWISTDKGLLHFYPQTRTFKLYTVANGLLSNQFNYQSSYCDKQGQMYFGGINGFVSFNPGDFTENNCLPPVALTDFMLFNKPVAVGEPSSPLHESITLARDLTLRHTQNSFSLRMAALSYQSPETNTVKYRLDGYDREWYTAGQSPVSYSNLPYGTYRLQVKAANSDGVWNPDVRTLRIRVLPPFYLTTWAYLIYFLLAAGTLLCAFLVWRQRVTARHRRAMERFEQKKEREMYSSKIEFFTNVAHEIRTPLTLIKGPLESVLSENELSHDVRLELETMDQNAERLLNLVNQLLDFRKVENKGFRLHPVECELNTLIRSTAHRFTALAKRKGISLSVDLPEGETTAWLDREAMTKIISNLLNNALKYGATYARLSLKADAEKQLATVEVANDGAVIPPDLRESIFRPFVRLDSDKENASGTGIGLPLARSLAELHHGSLQMTDSTEENRFVLTIPIVRQPQEEVVEAKSNEAEAPDTSVPDAALADIAQDTRPTLLVVEDDPEMRAFVTRRLASRYRILTAADGLEAMELLKQEEDVRLVVSDVMMPRMDGLELCHLLKSDVTYSHIPVILLTAKTTLEEKIEGLEQGADAYIEKPFSVEYLQVNVANLLLNRERLRRRFLESPFVRLESMAQTKADQAFMQQLNDYISAHIDEDLSVDDLAASMHMSRSSFYRKLKGALGMNPNDYLRIERLKHAARLLKEGNRTVSEIAVMVGFNSASYFSSCFKKQFGVGPKEFV